MADRDLTPDEARAEVEAFMGEGWGTTIVTLFGVYNIESVMRSNMLVRVEGEASTYRAAVDALKSAWRDAVRPWVAQAVDETRYSLTIVGDAYDKWDMTREETVARVLKEDSR